MAIDSIAAATNSFSPLLTNIGFGGLIGFLTAFIIKKLFKILAIIAGVFFAAFMYLEQQGIVNVNWDGPINRTLSIANHWRFTDKFSIYFFQIDNNPCVLFDKFFQSHYWGITDCHRKSMIPNLIKRFVSNMR